MNSNYVNTSAVGAAFKPARLDLVNDLYLVKNKRAGLKPAPTGIA